MKGYSIPFIQRDQHWIIAKYFSFRKVLFWSEVFVLATVVASKILGGYDARWPCRKPDFNFLPGHILCLFGKGMVPSHTPLVVVTGRKPSGCRRLPSGCFRFRTKISDEELTRERGRKVTMGKIYCRLCWLFKLLRLSLCFLLCLCFMSPWML